MVNLSPYADAESGAPSWRPGEREAAIVFLALTLYIILDVNVSIYRVFRKKQGLYYWSLIFATWGTATVAVGNIFKNLKPEWGVIWPLWTLMINGGWSVYAPAELLILYSRLHLVNQNERLHRWLLIMIVVGSTLIIIPNWVFIFGAYDIDPKVSSLWSPRMAIIDRVSQAGFTLFEIIISSVYIDSLLEILRTKITTRTRRVMRDLIFVNVTVICMDLLVIILIFLNQANLAYPFQDFTYAFKFKIEFAVLNQLMAVAASGSRYGSRQTTFEDRRYRQPGQTTMLKGYSDDDLNGVRLPFLSLSTDSKASPPNTLVASEQQPTEIGMTDHAKVAKPSPIFTKESIGISNDSATRDPDIAAIGDTDEAPKKLYDSNFAFAPAPDLELPSHPPSHHGTNNSIRSLREGEGDDTLLAPVADDGNDLTLAKAQTPQLRHQKQKKANRVSLRQVIFGKQGSTDLKPGSSSQGTLGTRDHDGVDQRYRIAPFITATSEPDTSNIQSASTANKPPGRPLYRRLGSRRKEQRERDENDDDEDGVHAWERGRTGKVALEAPWFQRHNSTTGNDDARSEKHK